MSLLRLTQYFSGQIYQNGTHASMKKKLLNKTTKKAPFISFYFDHFVSM